MNLSFHALAWPCVAQAHFVCPTSGHFVQRCGAAPLGAALHQPPFRSLVHPTPKRRFILRQIFAGLYRIVNGVAENSADVQRLHEVDPVKVNHSRKINLFLAGLCCLIFQNDVQKFISCMHIVLIVCNWERSVSAIWRVSSVFCLFSMTSKWFFRSW